MTDQPRRPALAQGLSAYLLWGFVPLFWPLVGHVPAWEILGHRVLWSFVLTVGVLLVLRRRWAWLRTAVADWPRLTMAAVLIACNWGVFIWAVNAGHVAETSLGYFLNPLVNVGLGVLLFRERPGPAALAGVGLAAVEVLVIALAMSGTVWVSLALAFSFGLYAAVKKRLRLGALEGLAVESGLLAPVAVGYLVVVGGGAFTASARDAVLLVAGGAVTFVPLWLFARAAGRIPLGVLGMLQYVAPTISLILSVTWFRQQVPTDFWVGLAIIWVGTLLYLGVVLRRSRRTTTAVEPDPDRTPRDA